MKIVDAEIAQYSNRLWAAQLGFLSQQKQEIFLYSTASRPALEPTHSPFQCVPGALSLGIKQPRREADHSPPSSAEVKNGGAIPPLPHIFSYLDAQLMNHKVNFTLFIIFGSKGPHSIPGVLSVSYTRYIGKFLDCYFCNCLSERR
jgi:hypothetical protein